MGSILQLSRSRSAATLEPDESADAREAELIERARRGDVEAWSRLYQEHFDRVFRHVAYLTGGTHVTEDLVQETFARAFIGLRSFEGRASFGGWLRGISINLVRKHWRSRYRGGQAMDRLEACAPNVSVEQDPEGAHIRQRRAEVLLAVLETLPASLREAFVLCDLQGLLAQEAAAELGISPGNVRVRATRARARIRGELIRLGWLPRRSDQKEQDDGEG